jgi:hypothetical protein
MVRESSNHNRAKKRYASNDHLEEVTRTSKSMMMIKEPEDICGHEMWDDIMSHGYETYIIRGMEKPRIAMANEVEKNSRKDSRKAVVNVVDIHTILILCAQAVAANDASETGDATQRLAQCFAKGLEARLVGMGSKVWQLLMAERLSIVEFLKAHNLYMADCSFNKVVVLFSTMTILQAMVGKRRLHTVDYGMRYGKEGRWTAEGEDHRHRLPASQAMSSRAD